MKISGYGNITNTTGPKKTAGTSQTSSFADILAAAETDDTAPVSGTSDIAATAALNNLLALQEISEEDIQRKRVLQQGKSLLDELENLRRQLLVGTLPMHILKDLNRQLSIKRQLVSDPGLNSLMDDIELRAAVELAKLEMAMKQSDS